MKSLKQYIFELNDATYLNLATKRKAQGKDINDILSHANSTIMKSFINDLKKLKYIEYSTKFEEYEHTIIVYFNEKMHYNTGNENLINQMHHELKDLCKKYGTFVHGIRFLDYYSDEPAHVYIQLLDRKKEDKTIKKDTILYHITSNIDNAKKIIDEGLTLGNKSNFYDYTYKCIFVFKSKKALNYYMKNYEHGGTNKKPCYLIEFKAGDNLYFPDWMLNGDLKIYININEGSLFTLSPIDKSQIISVTEISGRDKNILFSKN